MALPPTYATVKLFQSTVARLSTRESVVTDGAVGPGLARNMDSRAVRSWELTIDPASHNDVRHINDLWNITRGGILPMSFTPVGESAVAVAFSPDTELTWLQQNSHTAEIRVTLVEWFSP